MHLSHEDLTKILIISTIVIWVLWDMFAYFKSGNIATESWALKKWSYFIPGIACLAGILMGHIFFTFTPPETLCPAAVPVKKIVSPVPRGTKTGNSAAPASAASRSVSATAST